MDVVVRHTALLLQPASQRGRIEREKNIVHVEVFFINDRVGESRRKRERKCLCTCDEVLVCVCLCVNEREKEREREKGRQCWYIDEVLVSVFVCL